MLRCADDMVLRRWRDGVVRDVYAEFNRLTLRVTLEALFGARLAAGDESAGREITGGHAWVDQRESAAASDSSAACLTQLINVP